VRGRPQAYPGVARPTLACRFILRAVRPQADGTVPNWKAGDAIYFGYKTLRVVGTRDDDADEPPVLIVEETS
jgi:hypothetical protein